MTGRAALLVALVLTLAGVTAWGLLRRDPEAELQALRREVASLEDSAAAAVLEDTLPGAGWADSGEIYVGLGTEMVRSVLTEAARAYLRDVRLHVRPNAVVREGDEVRLRAGPLGIRAGRWEVAVTIQRVDALLSADSLLLSVADSARLDVMVPVHVSDATGDVLLDFSWDADLVTGVVCGDFELHEQFSGFIEPRTIPLVGYFALESGPEGTVARPVVVQRIPVSPEPTPESWQRVRTILAEQDRLFNCGLAISPERMEGLLRRLLSKGFTFPLPSSILRPVPLPTSLASEVEVAGRRARVEVTPLPPILSEKWLWFGGDLSVTAATEAEPGPGGDPGGG